MGTVAWICRQAVRAAPAMLLVSTVVGLLLSLVPALQVLVLAALIDTLTTADGLADVSGLLIALAAMVGLTPALTTVCMNYQHRAAQRLQAELNSALVRTVARIPPAELIGSRISAQVEKHSRAIGEGIAWSVGNYYQALTGIVSAIGVVFTVFSFSILAGILTLIALVPPLLHSRYVASVYERQWEVVSPHYDQERYLRELLVRQRSATELASLSTAERVAELTAERWDRIDVIMARALRPQNIGSTLSGLAASVLVAGALVSVVIGAHFGSSAAAGIYGVMAAMAASSGGGLTAGMAFETLPQTTRLRAFLEQPRPSRSFTAPSPVARLTVEHLTHRYPGRDRDAISDVSLEVRSGEIIALVGVNGAGKTTLVSAILGLIEPTSGAVSLDGRDQSEVGESAWLSHFGLLTQEFGRFELTVRDAVQLGTPREDVSDAEVWEALRAAHAAGMVQLMPDGLDQQLGEQFGGVGISGGQWQRLALARIHLRDSPVWVLDEPTSAIDAEAEQEIFHELQRNREGRITIVVSHRAWTLRGMDQIFVVDEGVIVQQGTYEELLAADGRFAEIFAEQA
jgi:ATP-binding cassette subfamily B protein